MVGYGAPVISTMNRRASFAVYSFITSLHTPAPDTTTRVVYPSVRTRVTRYRGFGGVLSHLRDSGVSRRVRCVTSLARADILTDPRGFLGRRYSCLNRLSSHFYHTFSSALNSGRGGFTVLLNGLGTLDPLTIVRQNCTITGRSNNGVVGSISRVSTGSSIGVRFTSNGTIYGIYRMGRVRQWKVGL